MNRQPRPAPSPDDARRLIGGGIRISRFGLGTAPLAGLFRSVAERDAVAAIETALDLGVTYFDTAPLEFPIRNPAVACVLVGCRSAAEVAANVRALDLHLPDAAWDDLLAESRPG